MMVEQKNNLAQFFNEFTDAMVNEVFAVRKSGMKDVLLPLCKKQKAYLYDLDKSTQFWVRINHVHELFRAQEFIMEFYRVEIPSLLTRPKDINADMIEGLCYIHPSAEIDPRAKIGPNVTIGA